MDIAKLRNAGLFEASVPRYTSYPPADKFNAGVGSEVFSDWLGAIKPGADISLYVHIPFCERLCWFCACRTQGVNSDKPVLAYLETLFHELEMVAKALQGPVSLRRLHFGGGSPNVLSPEMTRDLAGEIFRLFPASKDLEFSVEIDPASFDADKCDALLDAGMSRASFGIQDFDPKVQAAIGREQSFEITRDHVEMLRTGGVRSVNFDLVYGLPHQDTVTLRNTLEQVISLRPDRIALFGYAHVPWMAKRQKLIDEDTLPGSQARLELFLLASRMLSGAGYVSVGIDHFVLPEDSMAEAAKRGKVSRNFQGYTDDPKMPLIGVGASAVSSMPQGYAQNLHSAADYTKSISVGKFAITRGYMLSAQDQATAWAIERLMCDFSLELEVMKKVFPETDKTLPAKLTKIAHEFLDLVSFDGKTLTIEREPRFLARVIASRLDTYFVPEGRYSRAI